MLAVILPGFLAWVFLRLRGGLPLKVAIIGVGFLAVDGWFRFVMEARGKGVSVAEMAANAGEEAAEVDARHEGLNMFEELAWMNSFIESGAYEPNWGQRYFAEAVNPIPRVVWPGKPEIGLDYARARGMGWDQAEGAEGGVAATISTGMIGQGLANFGRILGPVAAALLMAIWVAVLARLDLQARNPALLLLYALGLVLTVNMGRDITLLVIYPFVFGLVIYYLWRRMHGGGGKAPAKVKAGRPPRGKGGVAGQARRRREA
jgi:hypothetical protein